MSNNDDLEIASVDDFMVQRDDEDNLQPVVQQLPGVEEAIEVIPMSMGDLNKYGDGDGQLDPSSLTNDEIAEILNQHWYQMRESDRTVTGDDLEEDMIGFGKESLITAILRASGYDLQQGLNMENLEMLDKVPEGKLDTMINLAENQG